MLEEVKTARRSIFGMQINGRLQVTHSRGLREIYGIRICNGKNIFVSIPNSNSHLYNILKLPFLLDIFVVLHASVIILPLISQKLLLTLFITSEIYSDFFQYISFMILR